MIICDWCEKKIDVVCSDGFHFNPSDKLAKKINIIPDRVEYFGCWKEVSSGLGTSLESQQKFKQSGFRVQVHNDYNDHLCDDCKKMALEDALMQLKKRK